MARFRVEGTNHDAKLLFAEAIEGVIHDEAAGAYYDDEEFKIAILDQYDNYLDNADQIADADEYED